MSAADRVLAAIGEERIAPLYLVVGERVLAEPVALEIAKALAERGGAQPEVHRRPARLAGLLEDLSTFSMFGGAKVVVAVETALFASLEAAADLVDEAVEAAPPSPDGELTAAERRAARRLLKVLELFRVAPERATPQQVVASLPDWVLKGGKAAGGRRRSRTKKQVEDLVQALGSLLARALDEGVESWAEGELANLGAILERGLPEGHALVLCERSVAEGHPIVEALAERQALVRLGKVASRKGGGWEGLDLLAEELERETGAGIARDALQELARRTLRQEGRGWSGGRVDGDSTERLAAEYRKLAAMSGGRRIDRRLVEGSVEDRGDEDVFAILDAIGDGKAGDALARIHRLTASADDATGVRLGLFSRVADFCRLLAAVGGMIELAGLPRGEGHYGRFKSRLAPALQRDLPDGLPNPLAGLHPYRLHRAYLAASRLPTPLLRRLPWRVLETELRLKGESADADAALADLVVEVAKGGMGASR